MIDFRNYYVRIFRKNVTSSGRSCISITSITSNLQLQGNCSNVINPECLSNNDGEQNKTLKIHRQFEHHNRKKIIDLFRDSKIKDK